MVGMASRANWQPLLDSPGDGERVRDTVASIVRALAEDRLMTGKRPAGLASGDAGIAVFLAYAADFDRDLVNDGVVEQCLVRALDAAATYPLGIGLFGGVAGVGWAAAHLEREAFVSAGEVDLSDLDELLYRALSADNGVPKYDLVSGLVGLGVYGLERGEQGRAIVELVVRRLSERARPLGPGIGWLTTPELIPEPHRQLYPAGQFNFGMAHGIPGVIAMLACAHQMGVAREICDELLRGAVTAVLSAAYAGPGPGRYPAANPHLRPPSYRPSRFAWCYGDPGVAMALLASGLALSVSLWVEEGRKLLQDGVGIRNEISGVVDAPFCHGTAGLAHIYNRAFNTVGGRDLRDAAASWVRSTMDPVSSRTDMTPWGFRLATDQAELRTGVLEGIAGIGLVLLSTVHRRPPHWDRVVCCCLPSKPSGVAPLST